MGTMLYQGHGSYRFTLNDGRVIYVDPYAGEGYGLPADVVLVTHGHGDHNKVGLVTQKPGCRTITHREALAGGKHNSFELDGIAVQAVLAKNLMHSPKRCVGYILEFEGLKIYCSGDTSKTEQMGEFAALGFDWAILCGDGFPNMGLAKAAECARLVGARHNMIVHLKPSKLFDRAKAEKWDAPNKVILEPGEEMEL